MESSQSEVRLKRHSAVQILAVLNILVVSLDRMGSACCDMEKAECLQNLDDFLTDWRPLPMLAEARRLLSEPFSTELGEDEMDELERELQHLHYWRLSAKKPPEGFIEHVLSNLAQRND